MRLELTGRHIEITPQLRKLVDAKLARLERLLNHRALSAQAVLSLEKRRHRADITLHARGEKFLHGFGASESWETSVGEAIEKIVQQAQKIKGKWQGRKRRGFKGEPIASPVPELEPAGMKARTAGPARGERVRMPKILRATRQTIRAMTLADATREIDGAADQVIVFRDVETASISVLYRKRNGELTLVETEA